MTSSAERRPVFVAFVAALLAIALLAWAVALARADAASSDAPAAVAARIAQELAPAWGVDATRVRVTCAEGALDEVADDDAIRLEGRGDDGWYVAITRNATRGTRAVRVRVGLADSASVATRALAPGDTLTDDDARLAPAVLWGAPHATTHAVTGWVARRRILPGDRLAPPAVAPPALIAPGQTVRVTFSRGEVRLTMVGSAVSRAGLGETVRVRVPGRAAPLLAVATSAGEARLEGGDRP